MNNCGFYFSHDREWEANIDKLDAVGLRIVARSHRYSSCKLALQVRWLEAQLTASEREIERLRLATDRPLRHADPVPPVCDAGCSCRVCAAEARAQAAEALLAEMVARHHALLVTVRGQCSDRERRYMRRSGVAVYHI